MIRLSLAGEFASLVGTLKKLTSNAFWRTLTVNHDVMRDVQTAPPSFGTMIFTLLKSHMVKMYTDVVVSFFLAGNLPLNFIMNDSLLGRTADMKDRAKEYQEA
jgi:hypothetical protein